MTLPLLAASDYGLVIASWRSCSCCSSSSAGSIMQGTRAQMAWRKLRRCRATSTRSRCSSATRSQRWKTMRMPKGTEPSIWHGVQSAELVGGAAGRRPPQRIGRRAVRARSTASAARSAAPLAEGMRVTAKLADMVLYDIPNVKLAHVQIDIYSTYPRRRRARRSAASSSTTCRRDVADALDWDEMDAEEVVRAFGGRFLLDDRGNPLPIDPDAAARPACRPRSTRTIRCCASSPPANRTARAWSSSSRACRPDCRCPRTTSPSTCAAARAATAAAGARRSSRTARRSSPACATARRSAARSRSRSRTATGRTGPSRCRSSRSRARSRRSRACVPATPTSPAS